MHDYILLWNSVALELNARDHTGLMNATHQKGPTRSSRALAIVHIAMHDAFFGTPGTKPANPTLPGLQRNFGTYTSLTGLTPPSSAAMVGDAVSAAASTVLRALYPAFAHVVDAALQGLSFGSNTAWQFGVAVAERVMADRAADDSASVGMVPQLTRYWRHREDPTNLGQGFLGAGWGRLRPFALTAFPALAPHPVPRQPAYLRSLDEVRVKGSRVPTPGTPANATPAPIAHSPRSPAETLIGLYWAYDGASQLGTPPREYNQIIRTLMANHFATLTVQERMAATARLLALVNVAMGDAGIAAWYYKYYYQLWRPILGIREHDDSFHQKGPIGGKDADKPKPTIFLNRRSDPFWEPYGSPRTNEPGKPPFTPPFPAYPSGHATFGAAAFEVVRLFMGQAAGPDGLAFNFVSDELDGRSIHQDGSVRARHLRSYTSLLDAMFDNAVSRVYLGVHWRFDGIAENVKTAADILTDTSNVGGVPLGRAIAADIYSSDMTRSTLPGQVLDQVWPGAELAP